MIHSVIFILKKELILIGQRKQKRLPCLIFLVGPRGVPRYRGKATYLLIELGFTYYQCIRYVVAFFVKTVDTEGML
jgi:hypothetical protein